jgi:DNA-binding MarR family transcriptional regulator
MEKFSEHLREFVHTIGRLGENRFELADMPINLKQHFILTMLSKSEEVFQTVIAEILRRDKSAVLREIDALEAQGLVLRVNDAVDRRKKRIVMTEAGRTMFVKGEQIVHAMIADLTQGISEAELTIFVQTMARITLNGRTMISDPICKP